MATRRDAPVAEKTSRAVQWVVLIAMIVVFVGQLGTGFHRPVQIAAGCLSGGLAILTAIVLWRHRKGVPRR
jgi:hypothetical protein